MNKNQLYTNRSVPKENLKDPLERVLASLRKLELLPGTQRQSGVGVDEVTAIGETCVR
jgi:hypothetical protein